MKRAPVVISLGGSLIAPASGVDAGFLGRFRKLISARAAGGGRFAIVCGGGATARAYQNAARKIGRLTRDDLDWLGIRATRLNAHLLRAVFGKQASPTVSTDPTKPPKSSEPVLVAGGWKPGWSTDYVAVVLASKLGAGMVINLSDVDYVYSADPKKNPEAKRLPRLDWKAFRKIVGDKWSPGANTPFDPVASKLAQRLELKVKMVRGKSFRDLAAALDGKPFKGTVIG